MTFKQLFDVLVKSNLTTFEEKEAFEFGQRTMATYNGEPMEKVRGRMGSFTHRVASTIGPDGKPTHTLHMGEDGVAVVQPPGEAGILPSIEHGQTPRPPLAKLVAATNKKPKKISGPKENRGSEARDKTTIIYVHPSEIFRFPDFTNPRPDEIDNYLLVMDYLWDCLFTATKKFKNSAFKDRIKDTMRITKIFKILVGSPLTTPAEKNIFRRDVVTAFGKVKTVTDVNGILQGGLLSKNSNSEKKKSSDGFDIDEEDYWNIANFG
ncbi:hypothetical protein EG329_009328 [Mollisiaceae sp. DMI_Dod_QoI]|nr:hypothetical protein EG329_009328 [Helotiales sp. DMI_Dod_QoI]